MDKAKPTIVIYLVFFIAMFVWAAIKDPTLGGFMSSVGEPWVLVVLLDFVFGCLLLSWMIYFIEGSVKVTLIWSVLLFTVGNIVGAIYILLNFNKIKNRIGAPA